MDVTPIGYEPADDDWNDLKPVLREFLPRGEPRRPAWASELMAGYW